MSSLREVAISGALAVAQELSLLKKELTPREKLIDLALKQVGTVEGKGNKILYNTWFYGREVFDGDKPGAKYPWCCTFICWLFYSIGKKLPRADYNNGWSSVPNLYAYAKKNNMLTDNPKPGDLVIYEFTGDSVSDHIGMFTAWENPLKVLQNIEGNTSYDDKGSQSNGGCTAVKSRNIKLVRGFINIDLFLK